MSTRKQSKINIRFLTEILSIPSKSKDDAYMINYLESYFNSENIAYEKDDYGNYYITKGNKETFPCIVAHIDTVHAVIPPSKFKVVNIADTLLYAMNIEEGLQTGIGGDDKVGIYIALQALKELKHVKIVLYRDEEIGHLGSTYSIKNKKDFYSNCSFILEPDRKHNSDFIYYSGGIKLYSENFEKAVDKYLTKYSYSKVIGVSTDVDTLVLNDVGVSCANISCGYYRPHTSTEVVNIKDVKKAYNLIIDLCRDLGQTKFEYHYVEPPKVTRNYSYFSSITDTDAVHKKDASDVFIIKPSYLEEIPEYKGQFYKVKKGYALLAFSGEVDEFDLKKIFILNAEQSLIKVNTDCPIHKEKDSIYYIVSENSFYCTDCNKYIEVALEAPLYKALKITVNNQVFVYDSYINAWYKEEDAIWDIIYSRYKLKE